MPPNSLEARPSLGALREVPYMGVIFVVAEAHKRGFWNGNPDWSNLGQGQPEVGEMEGAPPRILSVDLDPSDCAYGPLEGTPELRQKIADYYNRLYRSGKKPYGPENVAVAGGGRLALTRAMAAIGEVSVGYQLPDYTAYEDMFNTHLGRVKPVGIFGKEENGFAVTPVEVSQAIEEHTLGAYLFSNPCNPTGNVIAGDDLKQLVDTCTATETALLSDEFYSHFIYTRGADDSCSPGSGPVSAAAFVDDPEEDPVLIFDGLTKSHRYPGWRVGWVVGPSHLVETMARTASAIDGGPSRVAQRAALEALEPARADQETTALRVEFCKKRNLMIERLTAMGVEFASTPESTFYCWGSLKNLPEPYNDGMSFFWKALDQKVMTVPGQFFDVNPGKERKGESPYRQWMRFSFGPPMDNMIQGLDRLEAMLKG